MPERRKSPRAESLITRIEDITYSVLRANSYSPANDQCAKDVENTETTQ